MAEPDDDFYFCVEYSTDTEAEDTPYRYIGAYEEAIDFASEMNKKYPAVWLSEWGRYENQAGREVEGWVYFWWSNSVDWQPRLARGEGFPEGERSYSRKYIPLAEDYLAS